jgi:hypothetical protein
MPGGKPSGFPEFDRARADNVTAIRKIYPSPDGPRRKRGPFHFRTSFAG